MLLMDGGACRNAVAPATPGDLRWLRIRDMVSCGCGELLPEQQRRQRVIFNTLITPLVSEATTHPLDAASKALLIEAVAATGFRGSRNDMRGHYRQQFDSLLQDAMHTFEMHLAQELASLQHGSPAAQALVRTIPLSDFFGNPPASLFQHAAVGTTAGWVQGPPPLLLPRSGNASTAGGSAVVAQDLRLVYAEMRLRGALNGMIDFCDLIQCGNHRWFASSRPRAFSNCGSAVFWRHLGALLVVAQAKQLNAEFQQCVAALAARIPHVLHKAAGVKQCDRVLDKAAEYQASLGLSDTPDGGLQSVGRVVDVQRCSLCVDDPETAAVVLQALDSATLSKDGLAPLRRKNGFAAKAETVGGYVTNSPHPLRFLLTREH